MATIKVEPVRQAPTHIPVLSSGNRQQAEIGSGSIVVHNGSGSDDVSIRMPFGNEQFRSVYLNERDYLQGNLVVTGVGIPGNNLQPSGAWIDGITEPSFDEATQILEALTTPPAAEESSEPGLPRDN